MFWMMSQLLTMSHTEVFTSMAALQQLVTSERRLLQEVKNYVNTEEKKLRVIRRFVADTDELIREVSIILLTP